MSTKNTVWTIVDVESKLQPKKQGDGDLELLTVTYKEVGFNGKVDVKTKSLYKVYTDEAVYSAFEQAKKGDEIALSMVKNDKGYWDIDSLGAASAAPIRDATPAARSPAVAGNPVKSVSVGSNYPTAEERANTQRSIQRQSSLAQAVAYINGGHLASNHPSVDDVLEIAEQFVAFVNKSE